MLTLIGLTVEPGSFFLVNNTVAGCTGRLTQSSEWDEEGSLLSENALT